MPPGYTIQHHLVQHLPAILTSSAPFYVLPLLVFMLQKYIKLNFHKTKSRTV